jgi:hypothetical protein
MIDVNKIVSTAYRWIAIKFLVGIFAIAFCYAFLVSFFVLSDSWVAPILLSPSQERVLAFQPQIAALQAALNKQKIELVTAKATVTALSTQTEQIDLLMRRIDGAMSTEASQLAATSKAINQMLVDKRADIKDTEQSIADAQRLLKQVDAELASKLITSDQAAQRRVALQSALNAATDAKAQAITLTEQSRQMQAGSNTLRGGASSLVAITSVKQAIDLRALQAQSQIQLVTATATIEALEQSITENERVMEVAKTSPYFRALREPVPVAFVPYENANSVKVGMPVYDCYLKVIACRKVGEVVRLYDAEEYARHPLFKTDLKGRLTEIKFENPDSAQSQVLFVGGKPLFL